MKKKPVNYINNDQFYDALVKYLDECDTAESQGKQIPRVPEFIGECFLLLAKNVSKTPNWSRYVFVEDMQMDAVLNCIKYIRNFKPTRKDPETGRIVKSKPFNYFTQYVHNTYKQTIKDEKKHLYRRYKEYQFFQIEVQLSGEPGACPPEQNDISNKYIETYEESMLKEKQRKRDLRMKKQSSMESFFEDD